MPGTRDDNGRRYGYANHQCSEKVYHTFEAGNTKRMATYEDMKEDIKEATSDVAKDLAEEFTEEMTAATDRANEATEAAKEATTRAQTATEEAKTANTLYIRRHINVCKSG